MVKPAQELNPSSRMVYERATVTPQRARFVCQDEQRLSALLASLACPASPLTAVLVSCHRARFSVSAIHETGASIAHPPEQQKSLRNSQAPAGLSSPSVLAHQEFPANAAFAEQSPGLPGNGVCSNAHARYGYCQMVGKHGNS